MAVANQPALPPGASSNGVRQEQCVWFCLIRLTSREKNNYYTQQIILLLLILFEPYCHQKKFCTSPTLTPGHTPSPYCKLLLLVGGCMLICRLAANLRHCVFYFSYFCVAPFNLPNDGTLFPHTIHPSRATSPDSLPPLMPTLGWLLCLPFKFWQLKAKAKPIAWFFDGVCVSAPNEGTDHGAAKEANVSLAWTCLKTLRQELGPWRLLPWQ